MTEQTIVIRELTGLDGVQTAPRATATTPTSEADTERPRSSVQLGAILSATVMRIDKHGKVIRNQ